MLITSEFSVVTAPSTTHFPLCLMRLWSDILDDVTMSVGVIRLFSSASRYLRFRSTCNDAQRGVEVI